MPIVATAGHVDHGKSTLVEALTGTDPDRWAAEKERGLTIDLGFAWAQIGEHDVGFVDVPGHERFIKNMLAGVGAVDCALLVVAADSGWMPQTEEHAAVLQLLEVESGVIVLSRKDLVDDDTLELATLEVMDEVAGTTMERWPVVAVSATLGDGLDELRSAIADRVHSSDKAADLAHMWVDRAFHVAGAGTVATGTVSAGTVTSGQELTLYPADEPIRVRTVQHHGGDVELVRAGDRTAVSFTGTADVERGDRLAAPGTVAVSSRLLLALTPTRQFEQIPDRGAFHLHVGTGSYPMRLRRLAESDFFLAALDEPAPVRSGDRVIVRDTGRRSVVGGGRILDPAPEIRPNPATGHALENAIDSGADAVAQAILDSRGTATSHELTAASGGGQPASGVHAGDVWVSSVLVDELSVTLERIVSDYHGAHPSRPGVPKGEVTAPLGTEVAVVDAIVERSENLREVAGAIQSAEFSHELSQDQEAAWSIVRTQLESGFDVPRMSAIDLEPDTVHFLLRRGDLVRIGDDLAFTSGQIDQLVERVSELDDGFAVTEFKDHFGMSRRQAVPTLEWLDSIGRTRRQGDGRVVRALREG